MFIPNPKFIDIQYEINPNDYGDFICCWSPTLKKDVYLPVDDLLDEHEVKQTEEIPTDYRGSERQNQEWVILSHKDGTEFWCDASQFTASLPMDGEPLFKHNNDLDIDVDSITISNEYCGDNYDVVFENADGDRWEVGHFTDIDEGKIELYSACESTDSTGVDEEGDETYSVIDQTVFENIRQLFQAADFKVKVRRIRR